MRSGRIGGRLSTMFRDVGLVDRSVLLLNAKTTMFEGSRDKLRQYVEDALVVGQVSADEGANWLNELEQSSLRGCYCHTVPVFVVCGRKAAVDS
jgi:hypothetical protein